MARRVRAADWLLGSNWQNCQMAEYRSTITINLSTPSAECLFVCLSNPTNKCHHRATGARPLRTELHKARWPAHYPIYRFSLPRHRACPLLPHTPCPVWGHAVLYLFAEALRPQLVRCGRHAHSNLGATAYDTAPKWRSMVSPAEAIPTFTQQRIFRSSPPQCPLADPSSAASLPGFHCQRPCIQKYSATTQGPAPEV